MYMSTAIHFHLGFFLLIQINEEVNFEGQIVLSCNFPQIFRKIPASNVSDALVSDKYSMAQIRRSKFCGYSPSRQTIFIIYQIVSKHTAFLESVSK